jgi:glycosyltransferase involved in cell wall biosynthesis
VISAVIITLNEEKNIRRCLESVARVADEIIVADSRSTDATEMICREFGVNFISTDWLGYSATKNYGNSKAKFDYILSLDADEVLSEQLTNSILDVKKNLNGVYQFNRLTNYAGKWVRHCGWYPDTKVRLFPKAKTRWTGDFVHEVLEFDENLPVHHLKGDLLHYSYHTIQAHYDRIEKYSTLHAEKMYAEGKQPGEFKMFISPLFKFLRDYLLKLGFLDGRTGFTICRISAKAVFLKYKKLKAISKSSVPKEK